MGRLRASGWMSARGAVVDEAVELQEALWERCGLGELESFGEARRRDWGKHSFGLTVCCPHANKNCIFVACKDF